MQLAREAAAADHAIALLTTRNVSKGVFGAGLGHRVEMLLALHEDQPDISVFAANAARIADQAEALRACLPGVALDFIVGYDTLVRLFEPHFYADAHAELAAFFANHGVIAANRGDMDVQAVEACLERPDVAPFAPQIAVIGLDDYRASISSTEAREAVANGLVPETVPAPVLQYIREHRLYR